MRSFEWIGDGTGAVFRESEIPPEMVAPAKAARASMIEALADVDDEVLTLFLEGAEIGAPRLKAALRRATIAGTAVPVLMGAAFRNKGVQPLLDAVVDFLPSPADLPAVVGRDLDGERVARLPSDEEPFTALAFKIMNDEYVGQLTYLRVYAGRVETGATVFNATKGKRERIGRLVQMHANRKEEIKAISCGNIAAAVGLRATTTGDTLCDPQSPVVLELIDFPTPAMSVVIEPKTQAGQDSLATALRALAVEDPSFHVATDPETGQTLISGMGELHLEIIVDRLLREHKVDANVGKPQVAYRETVTESVEHDERFEQDAAGRGQYAHVRLRLGPGEPGSGVVFVNEASVDEVPREYQAAVERGVRGALSRGVLAGFTVTDVKISLVGGSSHAIDSSDIAFQIAASQATAAALQKGVSILLEPVMSLEVVTPEEFMGAVIGNISARRGRVVGMEGRGGAQAISAEVPLATMFGYSTDVRSLTQGRATFSMQFLRYAPVPAQVSEAIVNRVRGS
jgi:elongation factor G